MMTRTRLGNEAAARLRRGMTLIEILVVVAIIATLASILFPVFLSARESARQTKCLNNLRSIGSAFSLYLSEWDDGMPSTVGGAHFILLNRYIKAPAIIAIGKRTTRTVWECPSMPSGYSSTVTCDYWDRCKSQWPWFPTRSISICNSYLMNSDACIVPVKLSPRRYTEIRMPTRLVLMTEACYSGMWRDYNSQRTIPCSVQPSEGQRSVSGWCIHTQAESQSLIHPYHNGGANFLHCDMHVVCMRYVPPMEQWDENYIPRSPLP